MFTVVLEVKPTAKGRARATKTGRMYTPAATVNAETEIRWLLQKANAPRFEGPVRLWLDIEMVRPKSCKPKKRPLPTVKPDLSNVLKLIEDAANSILFFDDAQICEVHMTKTYGDKDQITLACGPMLPGD